MFCRYINYAKEAKASTRCFHFEVPFEHALHNEKVSQLSKPAKSASQWIRLLGEPEYHHGHYVTFFLLLHLDFGCIPFFKRLQSQ